MKTDREYFLEANVKYIKTIHINKLQIAKKKWFDKWVEDVDVFGVFVRKFKSGFYQIDENGNPLYLEPLRYDEYVDEVSGNVFCKPTVSFQMTEQDMCHHSVVFETNNEAQEYFDKYVEMMHKDTNHIDLR